jgi:hypothetical protein
MRELLLVVMDKLIKERIDEAVTAANSPFVTPQIIGLFLFSQN